MTALPEVEKNSSSGRHEAAQHRIERARDGRDDRREHERAQAQRRGAVAEKRHAPVVGAQRNQQPAERRIEDVSRHGVQTHDDGQHHQEEAGRRRARHRNNTEVDVDDRHAQQPVRRAERAGVVDDLGDHLGQAEGDQREIDAAHADRDDAADEAEHQPGAEPRGQRQPERRHRLEDQRGEVGAQPEVQGLSERQQTGVAEQDVDREREAAEDQRLGRKPQIEGVVLRRADRGEGEAGEDQHPDEHVVGAGGDRQRVRHVRAARTDLAGAPSASRP